MIISASRRTDIPTYYSDWFFNRIKEGFVFVRNPMNAHQISRIDLRPDVVDGIVYVGQTGFIKRIYLLFSVHVDLLRRRCREQYTF